VIVGGGFGSLYTARRLRSLPVEVTVLDRRNFHLFQPLAWLFIHLMYLVQFGNRVLTLVQWAWNYVTWNRSARLITEPSGASRSSRGS